MQAVLPGEDKMLRKIAEKIVLPLQKPGSSMS
jgi:hypothetical protein